MKKLYELLDLEKIILERLKERGYKYIFRDSLTDPVLFASFNKPVLLKTFNEFKITNNCFYVEFELFFDFIKFPVVYDIDQLLIDEIIRYEA